MSQSELMFDPFAEEFVERPYEMFSRLRHEAPVYYNEQLDFYALSRYADVVTAFKDHKTFSNTGGLDLAMFRSGTPPPQILLFMDPPEHRRMRSLVSKAFTPRAIQSMRETAVDLVRHYLGTVDPDRFDVMEDFAGPFPVDVVTRMIGVPEEFSQQVRYWFDLVLGQAAGRIEQNETSLQAFAECGAYFFNLVQERRAAPKDDMVSALIAAEVPRDGGGTTSLEDYEIALFAMMLAAAGTETVTKMVGNAVALFARHPDQWRKLIADRRKIPAAVEEVLRYDGPVLYMLRVALDDVEVRGIRIPKNKPVLLCLASANRDSDAFDDAETFDIDRDQGRAAHLGFGTGIHTCLGAALARMETAIALDHLLDFMPRYDVAWEDCRRVNSTSVSGYASLPVRVLR